MGILDFLKRKKPLEKRTNQQFICNISPETDRLNKRALELAQKERERLYGSPSNINLTYWMERQKRTYRQNKTCLKNKLALKYA